MVGVTIRYLVNGQKRYDARLRVGGEARCKAFDTKKEAADWRKLMLADDLRGLAVDPSAGRERLADYAPRFMENRTLAPRTVELYESLLARIILPKLGRTQLRRISPEAVRSWRAQAGREFTELQAAKAYRLLQTILNTASADGLIGKNPCAIPGAGVEKSAERELMHPPQVMEIAQRIAPRFRALVLLAATSSLRLGELLALERRHVDLDAGTLLVVQAANNVRKRGTVLSGPKTPASRRTVHLPPFAVEALAMHLESFCGPEPGADVFTGVKGGRLSRGVFQKVWTEVRAEVGAERFTFHDLRHTAGTTAAWSGATTRELMGRLGHTTPRAAMRYQHAASHRDRDIAAAVGNIFQGGALASAEDADRGRAMTAEEPLRRAS